ncbi:MAG: hypothetical protein IPI59_09305 [Sphingobacteriales bacterium]|jgi:hypothetical protein|nr:hypothetical protein [Sphingobacteriales bacterium]MBP9140788.1 hypothetical protein [Chitinophagales bacterium]MDA0199429.1 hypothetical protein [Bacteroidota bacterium]MBK6889756.1 hypothetical protein [Sphingobacteriales bacterium]MBK7527730.1 hypothetical protein [Sphingobacteriales bacterium]
MNKSIFILVLSIFCLALSSCSRNYVPFTEKLYTENSWSESDLQRIQFYLSDDIVIYRQLKESSSEIISGKIKMEQGRQIEEITIQRGTPGVLLYTKGKNSFAISFEEGQDSCYLTFGPNPNYGNQYRVLANDWTKKVGTVHYAGKQYQTRPFSIDAYLMVDMKKINKLDIDRRKAKGRKIN